jgi:acetyltransferase (GNAT) family protein
MPRFDVVASCPIRDSFRVQQIAGMFDLPLQATATERWSVELPIDDAGWQIGLIVGPSGSGKTTVARHVFGEHLSAASDWPTNRAVIDCFGDLPVRKTVALFTAVGFGSPPSWVKPYQVLSCGERFRCDLARALANSLDIQASSPKRLVVFDEFTSVVDRTVAKVSSAAIAKGIRRGHLPCRFVAVTCHYDVAEWLEPDWVLDMATCGLNVFGEGHGKRRRLRRPAIELAIHRCRRETWELFKRHHYLNAALAPQARCYLATWNGVPVNFCATLPMIAKPKHRRFTRIVTLPDFQGLGIGMRATAAVAALHRAEGFRINVTSSHPTLIHHCRRSPLWKARDVKKSRATSSTLFPNYRSAAGRTVVSFEYIGA